MRSFVPVLTKIGLFVGNKNKNNLKIEQNTNVFKPIKIENIKIRFDI